MIKHILENCPPEKSIPIAAVPFIFPHYSRVPCIRALVTFKSRLYHSTDTEKTPSSFVIHLMDESSEILTEALGRILVEEVYHRLQIGRMYYFYYLYYNGPYTHCSYYFNLRNRNQLSLKKSTVIEEVSPAQLSVEIQTDSFPGATYRASSHSIVASDYPYTSP
jgi:hypothetical protein